MERKWAERLGWLFVAACFLWSCHVTWNATEKLLDGDASSEMVLSSILSEDGGILTTRWHYSTELRVLNTQLVFTPLFHVFSDWHKIRFTGAMILQVLLLLSYGYFCQSLGGKKAPCLVGGGLMLLPRSIAYGRIVLYHSYYMPHILFNFLLFGLFMRLTRKEKRIVPRLLCFLALSFGVGLGGVRHGMITFAPLLLAVFLRTVRILERDGLSGIQAGDIKRQWTLALAGCAAFLAGYRINSRVLAGIYQFSRMENTMTVLPSSSSCFSLLHECLHSFGYDAWYVIFSVRGIIGILGLMALIATAVSIAGAMKGNAVESAGWYAPALCACVGMVSAGVLLITDINSKDYERFLLPALALTVPALAAAEFWRQRDGRALAQRGMAIFVMAAILFTGLYHSLFYADPASRGLVYTGLEFGNKANVEELEDVANFLEEEGYTLGYAPFWQASVLREMTDGRVKTLAMEPKHLVYYRRMLNEWQLNDPQVLKGEKHFIVTANDDTDTMEKAAQLQFAGSDYSVWTFASGEELWEFVN